MKLIYFYCIHNQLHMKKTLLFLGSLAFVSAYAQQPYQMTPKEAEKHEKAIAKSKENGDIICDYDTIYIGGVANSLIYKIDHGALIPDDFSIRSLSGQELIYVRYATAPDYTAAHTPNQPPPTIGYYSYVFSDTKNIGEMYSSIRPFKTVGRFRLINGNAIDPNAEATFIAENPVRWSVPPPQPQVIIVNNPPPAPQPQPQVVVVNNQPPPPVNNYSQQPQAPVAMGPGTQAPVNNYNAPMQQPQVAEGPGTQPQQQQAPMAAGPGQQNYTGPNYSIAPRNTGGDIRVDGNGIYQGDMQIGTIQYNEVNANGNFIKTLTVILPNGTKAAQAYTQPNGDPHAWNIITMKDHAQNMITSHEGHDKEEVLWFLVKGQYL
jgi:hypothetical protein